MGGGCVNFSHCDIGGTVLGNLRPEAALVLLRFSENYETCIRIADITALRISPNGHISAKLVTPYFPIYAIDSVM